MLLSIYARSPLADCMVSAMTEGLFSPKKGGTALNTPFAQFAVKGVFFE